jgi:putative oxidoreductase
MNTLTTTSTLNKLSGAAGATGRVLLSLIFVWSGFGKLSAPAATKAYMAAMAMPMVDVGYVVAVAVELGLGLALLFGYKTRFAALILAGFSIVTGFIFHTNFADQAQMINFMKNVAMAGGFLQVAAFGATAYSIDALLAARHAPARRPLAV